MRILAVYGDIVKIKFTWYFAESLIVLYQQWTMEGLMQPNVSSLADASERPNDSLESLGLCGMSLMQLWGAGIESVSDLTQHTAESLRKKLKDSSEEVSGSRKRTEQTLTDVLEAVKRRHQSLKEGADQSPKKARDGSDEPNQPPALLDDVSEHEKLDVANASAPVFHDDSLAYLYAHIKKRPVLGRNEQAELVRRYQKEGDITARNKLVTHNLRLVLKIARGHLWSELEYADLVQEGTIGLMTAVEKFDTSFNNAFSTYATWWIRSAIGRFIVDFKSTVRVPAHLQELIYKVRRTMDDIALAKGRPPTIKEVAETLALEPKKVKQVLKVMKMKISSLNESVSAGSISSHDDGNTMELQDMLFDQTSLRADHVLEARQELVAACERINQITEIVYKDWSIQDRDKEIFVRFYGLDGTLQQRTLDLVAERYTITREGIRQIITKIWRKLQKAGCDSDHENLLEELHRIAALEKLANKSVSVN